MRKIASHSLFTVVTLLLAPVYSHSAPPQFHVGQTRRTIHPKQSRNWRGAQTQALSTLIWYPVDSAASETANELGPPGASIFQTHPAMDRPLSRQSSKYPLVLISHGFGGSAASMDWLGAQLAAHGYIVAAVNHPGNNALEPLTIAGATLWWERATDLSNVLDAMLADPQFGRSIDSGRIGAAGFSLGGYTVLELAGARTNLDAFFRFCDSKEADAICHPQEMPDIATRAKHQLESDAALQSSVARAADSYRDPRIRAVFAIAPAMGQAFNQEGMRPVAVPVEILAGEADPVAPIATNARQFVQLLPAIRLKILPGAVGHYTFLDTCTARGKQVAAPYCNDAPGIDRDSVHAQAVSEAVAFFH